MQCAELVSERPLWHHAVDNVHRVLHDQGADVCDQQAQDVHVEGCSTKHTWTDQNNGQKEIGDQTGQEITQGHRRPHWPRAHHCGISLGGKRVVQVYVESN